MTRILRIKGRTSIGGSMNNDIIPISGSRRSGGNSGYRLPFGKYKGQRLGTVPTEYIRWLVSQEWLSDYCRYEVMDELGRRGALYYEMVMQIIALKAEIDRLRKELNEAERRNHRADLDMAPADDEFARELKRSADSA
jgi:hypothetical protein